MVESEPIQIERTISVGLLGEQPVARPGGERIAAILAYFSDDPYAVELVLEPSTNRSREIVWESSRELWVEGCKKEKGYAGIGDVRVGPLGNPDDLFPEMKIQVNSFNGHVDLAISRSDVEGFLQATQEAVPFGRESEYYDIDDELIWLDVA